MRFKMFARIVALLLIFTLLITLGSCATSPPPPLEEIYDIVVELIEQSYAVNDLVFGYGLPVWEIGSEYAETMHIYSSSTSYEYVTEYTSYLTVLDIKAAMESVYSADYLDSLYVTLFDGYAYEEGIMQAQFHEDSTHLYQSKTYEPLVTWQRIYDYSTMRIVDGDATFVTIAMESHLEHEQQTLTVELDLIYENGAWRLDTPTY